MAPFRHAICALFLICCIQISSASFLGLYDDPCNSESTIRPNIVMILMDDLGYNDVGIMAGEFPTPNIDNLIADSVQFTRHYVHLMGSPSRTQFLTGRYAMSLGFGEFETWQYKRIIGIPMGQPTIAQWLSKFGTYTTYAVGKWNLGYANEQLLPRQKGFDHFYGFYQGAIGYNVKQYYDVSEGLTSYYDFWEDGEPSSDALTNNNTLPMYGAKIVEYLEREGTKRRNWDVLHKKVEPFFLYAALQSMHEPYPAIDEFPKYTEECADLIDVHNYQRTGSYKKQRIKYCALTQLTDDLVGQIVDTLKDQNLWKNTLIVFSSDNGGATYRGASNYPLRGTKGESFEGNIRVVAAVGGGIIEKHGQGGAIRTQVVSNLDWTPTLLHFAGYLSCIDPDDYTWQGMDMHSMILGKGNHATQELRDSLVLNIGDSELTSTSMLIQDDDGSWYKFINQQLSVSNATNSSSGSTTDKWLNAGDDGSGVWSVRLPSGAVEYVEYGVDSTNLSHASAVTMGLSQAYLFSLDHDISETMNILDESCSAYDEGLIIRMAEKAISVLSTYVTDGELFSEPIRILLDEHSQMVLKTSDGTEFDSELVEIDDADEEKEVAYFLAPFLGDDEYLLAVANALDAKDVTGSLATLYLESWKVPDAMPSSAAAMFVKIIAVLIVFAALLAICCTVVMYYCNKNRRKRYGPYAYTPIKDAEMEEAIRDQRTEVYIYS